MSRTRPWKLWGPLALSLAAVSSWGACAEPLPPAHAAAPPEAAPANQPATPKVAAAQPGEGEASDGRGPAGASDGPASCEAGESCGHGKAGHGESCGGASAPLRNPAQRRVKTADGAQAVHVGDAFAAPNAVPSVEVSELLGAPERWAGKRVRVTGDVTAMCHHRRGWFAVAAEDKSGRALRVVTTPVFLVPQGSVGRSAVAEGRVEVIEVPARFARHLAADHKLGDPAKMTGPQRRVVLRATAAEFR